MKLEDALLGVDRLRLCAERPTSRAELENAAHLNVVLNALWTYWRRLLDEFEVRLLHWGNRGNAALGDGRFLFIKLDSAQWSVKRKERTGWTTIAGDWGMGTLRDHLDTFPPRPRRFAASPEVRHAKASTISNRNLSRERCN